MQMIIPKDVTDAMLVAEPRTNLLQYTEALTTAPWSNTLTSATITGTTVDGVAFWEVAKLNAATGDRKLQVVAGYTSTVGQWCSITLRLLAGTETSVSVGSGNAVDPLDPSGVFWGGTVNAQIISGPGAFSIAATGLVNITGLSASVPTVLRVSRLYYSTGEAIAVSIYPGTSASTTIGASVLVAKPILSLGDVTPPYQAITTSAAYTGLPSSVPETDYAAWSAVTAYVAGNRVISTVSHSVYECVLGHTNQDPVADVNPTTGVGTYWLLVGATNRWKAFDKRLADQVSYAGPIVYSIQLSEPIGAIAFFNLQCAAVRVTMIDPTFGVVFDTTVSAVDQTSIIDWWTYFYEDIAYSTQIALPSIPGFSGTVLRVEIAGTGTNKVGQIVLGKGKMLGTSLVNGSVGITDYSTKDRDTFGNPIIVPRAFASLVDFRFSLPSNDTARVAALLASMRATPAIYYADEVDDGFGTTVYGYFKDFTITLASNPRSFASMQIEGLV